MSEIERINLIGFQSHNITYLEPAAAGQLTVIVGPSDSGKTAILRALRWLFYNTPQGTDFIKVGHDTAGVRVTYKNGKSVTRARRRQGLNKYEITDNTEPDDDIRTQKFEGFGNTVPLEVQQITGVRPVQIGDLDLCINLADQLSGPFLGSDISAPMRAKVLGKLAGTEEVDYAAKSVGTDLYRRRQDEKRFTDDVTRLTAAIEEYAYLDGLGKRIEQADALLAGLREKAERLNQLKRLRDDATLIAGQLWDMEKAVVYLGNLITLTQPFIDGAGQKLEKLARLQDLSSRKMQNEFELVLVDDTLYITAHIEDAVALYNTVTDKSNRLARLVTVRVKVAGNIYGMAQTNAILAITDFVGEAELLRSCATKHLERHTALDRNWAALASLGLRLQTITATLDATQHIEDAVIRARMLQDDITLLGRLQGASERYIDTAQSIRLLDMRLSKLAGINEAQAILDAASANLSRAERMMPLRNSYNLNNIRIASAKESAQRLSIQEQCLVNDYKNALLAAGVCPVCGSVIDENNLKEAI